MIIIEFLEYFYKAQREIMETEIAYLIFYVTVALIIYFFSSKNSVLAIFPLVAIVLKYVYVLFIDLRWIRYFLGSFIRFIITSYVVTYGLIYSTYILLTISIAFLLLYLTDKYDKIIDIPYYNIVFLFTIFLTFGFVKKLQAMVLTIVASIYSSIVLLNSIEILTKIEIGMKNFSSTGILCISLLSTTSLFIQKQIHRKKK